MSSTTQAANRPFAPSTARKDSEFGATRTPASPSQLEKLMGEPTVTMFFPRAVLLTLPGYKRVRFEAGIQEVPQSLAANQYLADHGVTQHDRGPATPNSVIATELPDLNKMTKVQLMEHAQEAHGLDLDGAAKKEDLIKQIEEARDAAAAGQK